jgi:hypothetical protein
VAGRDPCALKQASKAARNWKRSNPKRYKQNSRLNRGQ